MRVGPALLSLAIPLCMVGCSKALEPVALDTKNDQCGTCRMVVSAETTASQIVAPNQEPRFFDDLGCLDQFLAASPLSEGARVFVADHRTGEWVPAESAVFTKMAGSAGAMGSPYVAHASSASRDADGNAAGAAVPLTAALPSFHLPGGSK